MCQQGYEVLVVSDVGKLQVVDVVNLVCSPVCALL